MKSLHRPDLFSWSSFDNERNVDFNGYAWTRPEGNVLFDPVAMSEHDFAHLQTLGGAHAIVLTNSDHVRAAPQLAERLGATLIGPRCERAKFPVVCQRWLSSDDVLVKGLETFEMEGSKTDGELAFILDKTTLITGDLIRAHRAGSLMMLPEPKLKDPDAARRSVRKLARDSIEHVLVGDGWPAFGNGGVLLAHLVRSFP